MTKHFNAKTTILLCCLVVLFVCTLLCAQFIAPAQADSNYQSTYITAPTFTVLDGKTPSDSNAAQTQSYDKLFDGSTSTKYCVELSSGPYVVFKSSHTDTKIIGYTFYTGDDTAKYPLRNPQGWTLYGCNDYNESTKTGTWTAVHTVTNDETMGAENKTGYTFNFDPKYVFTYFKFEFTARRGLQEGEPMSGSSGTWYDDNIQLSEIEIITEPTPSICDAKATFYVTGSTNVEGQGSFLTDRGTDDGNGNRPYPVLQCPSEIEIESSMLNTVITGYKFFTPCSSSERRNKTPKSWVLYGRNNGGDWTEIHQVTNQPSDNYNWYDDWNEFSIPNNTTPYKYYKFTFLESNSSTSLIVISEIEMLQGSTRGVSDTNPPTSATYSAFTALDGTAPYGNQEICSYKNLFINDCGRDLGKYFHTIGNANDTRYVIFKSNSFGTTIKEYTILASHSTDTNVSWSFYGCNDHNESIKGDLNNGSWTLIDSRSGIKFNNSQELNNAGDTYTVTNPAPYKYYKFEFKPSSKDLQISRLIFEKDIAPIVDNSQQAIKNSKVNVGVGKDVWFDNDLTTAESVTYTDSLNFGIELNGNGAIVYGATYHFAIAPSAPSSISALFDNTELKLAMSGTEKTFSHLKTIVSEDFKDYTVLFDVDRDYVNSGNVQYTIVFGSTVTEQLVLAEVDLLYNFACEHSFTGSFKQAAEGNCLNLGYKSYRLCDFDCGACQYYGFANTLEVCEAHQYASEVAITHEHSWGAEQGAVDCNCVQDGNYAYSQCSVCNAYKYVNKGVSFVCTQSEFDTKVKIPATGEHVWSTTEIIAEVPATCTSTGTKAHWHCDLCNKNYDTNKTTQIDDLTIAALGHSYTTFTFGTIDGKEYHWYKCSNTDCESADTDNKVACVIKYENKDADKHVSYCEVAGERHELGKGGVQLTSDHSWKCTFMQAKYDADEGSYHDDYCEVCDTWKGKNSACTSQYDKDDDKHWLVCNSCKHAFPSEQHNFQMLYNSSCHYMRCSVCAKVQNNAYVDHTFESPTSTSCSETGCGYQRFFKLDVEIDGYEINASVLGLKASATTDRTDVNPSFKDYRLYDSDFNWIYDSYSNYIYDDAEKFSFNTIYYAILSFDCGNVYPSSDMIAADIKLPEGFEFGLMDFTTNTHADGTVSVQMDLLVVMSPVADPNPEKSITEIEIDFKNFEVGNEGSRVEIDITGKGVPADKSFGSKVLYFADAEGYFVRDSDYTISAVGYEVIMQISAPYGFNFYGLTESGITIKNGMGTAYMMPDPESSQSKVSEDGKTIALTIVLNSLVPEHVCGANGWRIVDCDEDYFCPDITTQHSQICLTCGAIEFVDHVYTSDFDMYCYDCYYERKLKLDEMHFTLTGYQSDALIDDIDVTYSGKYASIVGIQGIDKPTAWIFDFDTMYSYSDAATFVPGKVYGICIDLVISAEIDIVDCLFDNVYVNGIKVKVITAEYEPHVNESYVFYMLQLPAVTGESEQTKVSNVNLNVGGFEVGYGMEDISFNLDTNAGINTFSAKVLEVGSTTEGDGIFKYGKQYALEVTYLLNDGYYGMGVTADDLKVSHYAIDGDSQKIDLGNFECISIIVDDFCDDVRTITCTYLVVLVVPSDVDEEHDDGHIFPTENPTYHADENKHYVLCGCGAHDEGEAHVYDYESDTPLCCTVCGYWCYYSAKKMEFKIDWHVGNAIFYTGMGMQVSIDDIEVFFDGGFTNWDLYFTDFDIIEGTQTLFDLMMLYDYGYYNDDIVLANRSYTLRIKLRYINEITDFSALTKNDYIINGIGKTPITANYVFTNNQGFWTDVILVFYIPATEVKHIHGGTWVDEVPATCTVTGTKAHYVCTICGDNFDAENVKIDDLTIPATHKFGTWIDEVPATLEKEGTVAHKDCEHCHKHFDANGNEIADENYVIAKIKGYNLIFKIDGNEVAKHYLEQGAAVTYPESGSKLGFTFAWSQTIATMPNSDVTIEGVYSIDVNYFKSKVDAVQNATTVEDIYSAIVSANTALALYDGMDTQSIADQITRLSTLIDQYKQMAQAAENDVKNTVNVVGAVFGALVQMAIVALATVIVKRRLF